MDSKTARIYFIAMAVYWLGFGLITIFYPPLMDLFQTDTGIGAGSAFSDHVWMHAGFDILSVCALVFALSSLPPNPTALRGTAVAALGPTIAIGYSLVATPYWSPIFAGAGLGCLAFSIWGFVLAGKVDSDG